MVVIALPLSANQRILDLVRQLRMLPVGVHLLSDAIGFHLVDRPFSRPAGIPAINVVDRPISGWSFVAKRTIDVTIASIALVALMPIFAMAAVLIKLDSPGPVLFRQRRYGFDNELIEVFKFRSMHVSMTDHDAAKLTTRNDPRVTRVGRFIRKTSLDELPQLFNVVLKGDLSLVGPRPHALQAKAADQLYEQVFDGYFARHRVRPGITGWAQVNGWRGETDTAEKLQRRVEYDLDYIENWSVMFDLYILMLTPFRLLNTENAF
jgi:Undecaprenyl-phosphate glucose phosphotransferase